MDLKPKARRTPVGGNTSGIAAMMPHRSGLEGVSIVVYGQNIVIARAVAGKARRQGVRAATALGDLTSDGEAFSLAVVAPRTLYGIEILRKCARGNARGDNPNCLDFRSFDWQSYYRLIVVGLVRLVQKLSPGSA